MPYRRKVEPAIKLEPIDGVREMEVTAEEFLHKKAAALIPGVFVALSSPTPKAPIGLLADDVYFGI